MPRSPKQLKGKGRYTKFGIKGRQPETSPPLDALKVENQVPVPLLELDNQDILAKVGKAVEAKRTLDYWASLPRINPAVEQMKSLCHTGAHMRGDELEHLDPCQYNYVADYIRDCITNYGEDQEEWWDENVKPDWWKFDNVDVWKHSCHCGCCVRQGNNFVCSWCGKIEAV